MPNITALPDSGENPGRAVISRERLDLLDATDVLTLTYPSADVRRGLEASPLFKRVGAVRRGAYVVLEFHEVRDRPPKPELEAGY